MRAIAYLDGGYRWGGIGARTGKGGSSRPTELAAESTKEVIVITPNKKGGRERPGAGRLRGAFAAGPPPE